ncbi:MAG: PSD1 and planctomycete cytochrome C domain-containing protein [Planctomycetaceae bacterium]
MRTTPYVAVIFLVTIAAPIVRADDPTKGEKLFALRLKSLFAEKCLACHGADPEDISGGLDMRTRDGILKGGESFEADVLHPGKGATSYLYLVTTRTEEGYEMPPKEAEKLSLEQQNWIRDWINEGAPWPSDERVAEIQNEYAEGVVVPTSGGLSDDWTNRRYDKKHLWAYKPLDVVKPPADVHAVDWFIDRKLKAANIKPLGDAAPRELARRLSFGLTGLPPQVEEISQFVQQAVAGSDAAVQKYVDELMASPHYGEHFGRHWLDVARYADTAGFANDYARPNAWRYRDYVVRAFNNDKPFDDFVREQIAGDEIDPNDPEKRIATGFLRMGPWEQTAMSVFRVTRQQWLDDVVDSVGQSFLGHPLQCAKCHDHKFDPVPTRDYYSMMAVFSTTQFAERNTPFLESENKARFKPALEWTKAKIAAYQKQRTELQQRVQKNRKSEQGDAKVGDNGLDPGDEASLARMGKNIARHNWELQKVQPIAFGVYTGKTIERKSVGNRLKAPKDPWAKGNLEEDTILTGGDAYSRGAPVTPAPLSAAAELGLMTVTEFPGGQGKRRLALADWITHENNPLTARVIVNRVWSWHFGRGIAGNPNNVGSTGKLPTHPQLLDYLADWFVKHDWSIKQLNKLILTSRTYRRSTRTDGAQVESGGDHYDLYKTFAPRRLTAEELRDAMLAASGELNREVGGIPVRPDINMEVAMQPRQIMGGTASVYEPDPLPKQRNRRTIYAEKIRGLRDPFMESFNQPGSDKSCELRETSTVAPQALTLFNAEEVQDRALAFAHRLVHSKADDAAVIQNAFEIAIGRAPTEPEQQACLTHWQAATKEEATKAYKPRRFEAEVARTVMAEKTGEPYDFVEVMPAYKTYQPDLQPHQTDARTRGLAQVCLVIFNLNEFAYVD